MSKIILQLGAGQLMTHSIRQIRALGYQVYDVDKNPSAPAFPIADGYAPIDLMDVNGITTYAREISADAILAVNKAGVLAASMASAALGLRNLPLEVAHRALDKGLMRQAWHTKNLSQPEFSIVEKIELSSKFHRGDFAKNGFAHGTGSLCTGSR